MHELLVLADGNKVSRRAVTVGPKVGNYWLIEKGLAAGDKVLIEGVQKVRPDMVVNPKVVKMDPISPPKEGTAPPIPPAPGSAAAAEPAPSASAAAPKPAKTPKK
jgi:membrane fusion protein (multidrug efflux system)